MCYFKDIKRRKYLLQKIINDVKVHKFPNARKQTEDSEWCLFMLNKITYVGNFSVERLQAILQHHDLAE